MNKNLKTGFALLALTLGLTLTAHAQKVEYGIKAGAQYSSFSYGNKSIKDEAGKIGAHIGVFARTTEKLYFQPELNFSMFKAKYTYESKVYTPKFYQANLPLQVGYKVLEKDDLNLRVSAGPQLNYDLKKVKATATTSFKQLSYDALINVGADVEKFTFDLRFNYGLNKRNKDLGARNETYGLSVGYKF
ncbi:porin family protein [Sphingobacterium spiritivorum]|uniref:porin family protein n=1 Tax=Sphingobacterium spiritivorum TaxID=258 RepID=UPI003DA66836